MTDTPTPMKIEPSWGGGLSAASIVWILPLLALLIAMGVAWQAYASRGPLITIEFENGAGIVKKQTELRYRDIGVGVVEKVEFTEGLDGVLVHARVDKGIAPYIDSDASFWVVRPELTISGVSGLDTVLSGVFIEGTWDGQPDEARTLFKGLETAPLFRPDRPGLQIALRTTPDGALTDHAPIIYRGIEVGRVGTARIAPGGRYAIAEAIIYEPHGNLITGSTRFWDSSGFSVSLGPQGAEIDFSSVATLLGGGITFDTFVSGGSRVSDGKVFEVFYSQDAARASVFNASEVDLLEVSAIFDDNIAGLSVGSIVELSGLQIGTVGSVSGIIDPDEFGDNRVRLNAVLEIQPARLGLPDAVTPEAALEFLSTRVAEGLRARLATASLLTGGLKVELIETEQSEPGEITVEAEKLPRLPTTQSEVSDAGASVEGVINRINNLPIEQLLNSTIDFLNSAQAFVMDPGFRDMPQELSGLVTDVRGIVTSQEVRDIPVTLNAAIARVDDIFDAIEEQQVIARLMATVDNATAAASAVGASFAGVPELIAQLEMVAGNAAQLPLTELTEQLTGLLASAEAVLATQGAQDLPASLNAALQELNATLVELREGGAIENVNATLASTRSAADAVAVSTQDLPALVERISRVLDQASATIAGYNQGEALTRDAQAAMRDLSEAAKAIDALARMLERNPSALIRGR
jgi:paraquat-inducible protein B